MKIPDTQSPPPPDTNEPPWGNAKVAQDYFERNKSVDTYAEIWNDLQGVVLKPYRSDPERHEAMDKAIWDAIGRALKLLQQKLG